MATPGRGIFIYMNDLTITPAAPIPQSPAAMPVATPAPSAPAAKQDPFRRYAIPIDGTHFYLSDRERTVCETFIRTNGNVSECARQVNRRFKRNYGSNTIRRWLDRKRLVLRYLEEQGDKRAQIENFSPDEWRLLGIQVMQGKKAIGPIAAQIWKDWGRMEVHRDSGSGASVQNNIQIRFEEKASE